MNTDGWDKGWTNLANEARQSFTPTLPTLEAVEVELVVGNRGAEEERLTLTVLERVPEWLHRRLNRANKELRSGDGCDSKVE